MSVSFDRFLNARHRVSRKASLGRAFTVERQTWRLSDDPQTTPPQVQVVATRRTASEAADLAREAAWAYARNGFHKPSGAWWAAEGALFHRFVVRAGSGRGAGVLAALALAGIAAVAIAGRKGRKG